MGSGDVYKRQVHCSSREQPKAKVTSNPDLAPEPQGATAAAQGAPGEPQGESPGEPQAAPRSQGSPDRSRDLQKALGSSRSPKCPIHIEGVYREPVLWRQGSKPDFGGLGPATWMERLKLTTILHFGQWAHQRMTTVLQIDLTNWGTPCLIRKLELCKCAK